MSVHDRLPVVAVTDDTPSVEPEIGFSTRILAPNEFLFRTGETKTCLYRVNSGAVCLYEQNRAEHPVCWWSLTVQYVKSGANPVLSWHPE